MSFCLNKIQLLNLIDLRSNYVYIAEEFCKYYYNTYDTNFSGLVNLYYNESQFTFLNKEYLGFNSLHNDIKSNNLKFSHSDMHINVQPLGPKNMEICVTGKISFNDEIFAHNFTENLVLERDNYNRVYILSTIFKVIE